MTATNSNVGTGGHRRAVGRAGGDDRVGREESRIVAVAVARSIVALRAFESVTVNCSSGSGTRSPLIGTLIGRPVRPAGIVSVPATAV